MKKTVTATNKKKSDRTLRDLKEERPLWKLQLASLKRKNRGKRAGGK
jgi:hypothetical protein